MAVRSASAASFGRPRKLSPLASSIRLLAASLIHMLEMYDSTLASSSAGAICGMALTSLSRRLMSTDDARAADEAILPRGAFAVAAPAVAAPAVAAPAEASAADATDDARGTDIDATDAVDAEDAVRWRERSPKTPPVV